MTVVWAKKAYGDLEEIANYLAGLSDEAAERTIDRIQKAVLLLGEFPNMGTRVDRDLDFATLPFPTALMSSSIEPSPTA